MAHNSPTLLRHISISPMLLLIIIFMMIAIDPSYGYDDHHKSNLHDFNQGELLVEICSQTLDTKFCMDNIHVSDPRIPSEAETADQICLSALNSAQNRVNEVQSLIESLLRNSSGSLEPHDDQILRLCQSLHPQAIKYLNSAKEKVSSDNTIDQGAVVNDVYSASNYMRYSFDMVQQTRFADQLARIADVTKFCEIAIVSTNYFKK